MVRAPIFLLVWSNIFQCTGLSGIYLVLFTATTYVLLWGSKARKSIRSNMLVVSFAIFVIATMVRSGFFFPSMRLSLSVARQKRLTRSIWRRISLALSLPSSSTLTPLAVQRHSSTNYRISRRCSGVRCTSCRPFLETR